MRKKLDPGILHQTWLHSHEEDTQTETVYRPASFKFPPSRGRMGFQLMPDGRLVEIGIAPTDGPSQTPGNWKLEGERRLALYTTSPSTPSRVLEIARVGPRRLVVRK